MAMYVLRALCFSLCVVLSGSTYVQVRTDIVEPFTDFLRKLTGFEGYEQINKLEKTRQIS